MKKYGWIVLILIALLIIYFAMGGGAPPPGGPPGGAPPADSGSSMSVLPSPARKNTEFAYSGWIVKISDSSIEIRDIFPQPRQGWWGEAMRIDMGPETRIMGGTLGVGQLVQVTGIYPENRLYFTTNYVSRAWWPPYPIRRGTIEIIG